MEKLINNILLKLLWLSIFLITIFTTLWVINRYEDFTGSFNELMVNSSIIMIAIIIITAMINNYYKQMTKYELLFIISLYIYIFHNYLISL